MAKSRESYIVQLMNLGFKRAAESFSKFLQVPVRVATPQVSAVNMPNRYSNYSEEKEDLYVLVTQIIGAFSGKSYLILNYRETEEIFKTVFKDHRALANMKEALLMDIDNIVSASVISELANVLDVEIYGDVPVLKRIPFKNLQLFFRDEQGEEDVTKLIFTNTVFLFDSKDHIRPQFVWRLTANVFDSVLVHKISRS